MFLIFIHNCENIMVKNNKIIMLFLTSCLFTCRFMHIGHLLAFAVLYVFVAEILQMVMW